jgi:signal transduction histidine kinase
VDLKNSPEAHSLDADQLWNNWRASELWQRVGAADLGLSGEVEIIDEQGRTTSLFSAGFFRDLGYELVHRSEWEEGPVVMPRVGLESTIYLQREQRRFASGDEWVLRGEIPQLDTSGWISLTLPVRSGRISTLSRRFEELPQQNGGYSPRVDLDRPMILMRGDDTGWLDTGGSDLPARQSRAVIGSLRSGAIDWGQLRIGDQEYLCTWRSADTENATNGEGFLLGIKTEGVAERLLDLSRLILLDLLLLTGLIVPVVIVRWLSGRSLGGGMGFQERFLAVYLVMGMLPLLLAGMFIDRLSREWLVDGAKLETREGLDTAREQLQGLLAEQARALAGSDYIAELLESRMAGRRPMGPYSARQAMVFTSEGELLLDETLSDLDGQEAASLLQIAKRNALVMMQDAGGLYLGTVIPVDLTGVPTLAEMEGMPSLSSGPARRERDGYFFYRQRMDADLMTGLGEVIKGEAALHIAGEVVMASHAENVFSGRTGLLMSPSVARQLQRNPGNTFLLPLSSERLAWAGMLTMPMLKNTQSGTVLRTSQPAVMSVIFPARERDYVRQRERTLLFLAGLATLIFLTATLLGLALTWKIFDPVRVLLGATRRLASGDFDAPVPEAGKDELGTLSASFRAMRDDLRSAQRTLAESERFLARVLEGVPVGVVVLDCDHNVISLNPAARRMVDDHFGPAADDSDERVRWLLAGFERAIQGAYGEAELMSPDGSRTLRGRLAPLNLPDGRVHNMIVCEDVTEFLRTKKMAINAQLARQVAHEVKNPLTPIQLSIQFLQQAWKDGAENMDDIMASTIEQVLEQVELLRSIATEFSLLGRPDEITCQSLDFPAVVQTVVNRYLGPDGQAPGRPIVHMKPGQLPPVSAHEDSLAKVIANLMENSLQAAGDDADLIVDIDWLAGERNLTLIWKDNGSGLLPEVAERLFDPYFSTKTQGTGLGLPICRSLLAGMGGTIALRNRADKPGAVAEVTLPLAASVDPDPS